MNTKARAFTLIELSVIVVLLALLASSIMPSVAALRRSRIEREFPVALRRLAIEARELAVSRGAPLALAFGDQLQIIRIVEPSLTGGAEQELNQVSLTPELTTGRLELAGQESNSADWRLTFYPDGTSDGGGVEFQRGNATFALHVDAATGSARIVNGPLPDTSTEKWQAGEIEHRL